MSQIAVFFAEGYEEIEGLTVVDICRRCGIETEMVAVGGKLAVTGGHGITTQMDVLLEDADFSKYDMLILPGGLGGTQGLEACGMLMDQVDIFFRDGKYIGAICAAPTIFGHRGILKGRRACCYPGLESHLEGALVTNGPVELDGNVMTSRGMGTALDFALAIAGLFVGKEAADQMAEKVVYRRAGAARTE